MNAPAEGYTELSAATSILAVALRTDPSLDFINDIAIEDNIKKLLNRLGISIENFTTILNSLHTDIVIELACILLDCAISEDRIALNFMRWFRDHQAVMPFLGYTDENGKFVLIRLADEVENCKAITNPPTSRPPRPDFTVPHRSEIAARAAAAL